MKLLILILSVFLSYVSYSEEGEYTIDRLDLEKELDKNSTVSIENLYGNILIKKAYGHSLVVHAVNQNNKINKNKAKFLITEKNNHVSIKIVFDKGHLLGHERSDITLAMPQNIHLSVIMDAGELTAKKINNPITVNAESAQIILTTKSQFNVLSKLGNVFVKILEDSNAQSSNIQSYKGDITLEYLVEKPYIDVISGQTVVSNSAELLMTKKLSKRSVLFNQSTSITKIKIINDTGNVILIDKNSQ